ncbi:hypothetical protein [Streptomyces sp. NBC_00878]|uniref:hypothetical protein n=1 Tax=Streptomyces sp. NBC_00878 TaxID=2975854 RepID=UPI0022587F62|nr:hypothetical protein [Streptomyces sp. NBC_00878]MCX4907532.1 hypothetical protein [Streptomyces sp. NBC_00878]
MRTLSRCLIPLLAAGCLAVTAMTAATPATASTADSGGVSRYAPVLTPASVLAPVSAPVLVPDPCDVDWPELAGLTDTATLREAIVACVESYTERDLDSWLQAALTPSPTPPPILTPAGTGAGMATGTGVTAVEDLTGADAADWEAELACDLAEIFDEPTVCRPTR